MIVEDEVNKTSNISNFFTVGILIPDEIIISENDGVFYLNEVKLSIFGTPKILISTFSNEFNDYKPAKRIVVSSNSVVTMRFDFL